MLDFRRVNSALNNEKKDEPENHQVRYICRYAISGIRATLRSSESFDSSKALAVPQTTFVQDRL